MRIVEEGTPFKVKNESTTPSNVAIASTSRQVEDSPRNVEQESTSRKVEDQSSPRNVEGESSMSTYESTPESIIHQTHRLVGQKTSYEDFEDGGGEEGVD